MSSENRQILLSRLRDGSTMNGKQRLKLVSILSGPAIIAQFASVTMQYIDAAMVGRLGASQAASIGLVAACTWLVNGFIQASSDGFTVQTAHFCGAKDYNTAKKVSVKGILTLTGIGVLMAMLCLAIAGVLPHWLGGEESICHDASVYFRYFGWFLPISAAGWCSSMLLQASGNTKVTSISYMAMCGLDVVFNYIFIYMLGMGVAGAAIGTGISTALTSIVMIWYLFRRSVELNLKGFRISFDKESRIFENAFTISWPLWIQNIFMRGAYIAGTALVAPLGAIAIAANSFAVTAESLCYSPGYGIQEAVISLVGQSIGAGRKKLARQFAWIAIGLAVGVMSLLAVLLYIFAPELMAIMTTDHEVIELGAKVLRIEVFAEAMFAAAIVGGGCCTGAGDTKTSSAINFAGMWIVRIGLSIILIPSFGLVGCWIGMCADLNIRGLLFLWRISGDRWLKDRIVKN